MSVEVAWFSALCDDDYRYLGVHDASLKSSWAHCSSITRMRKSVTCLPAMSSRSSTTLC
jgi:hypothetical protein